MIPFLAARSLAPRLLARVGVGVTGRFTAFMTRLVLRNLLSGIMHSDADEVRRRILAGVLATVRSLRVSHNIPQTQAWLTDLQRRKIPRVTAIALTRTAKELQHLLEAEVDRVFDNPVAFTKRAFAIKPANYTNLAAEVFIKTKQAAYLQPQVTGGRRQPKRSEQRFTQAAQAPDQYWVPGEGVRLNVHGNLSLAQVKKIAAQLRENRPTVFVGKPNASLPFGIWERQRGGRGAGSIKPLLVQVKAPRYRQRLDMHGLAAKHAQRIFDREFARAWRQIIG